MTNQTQVHISDTAWEHLADQRDFYGYAGRGGNNGQTYNARTTGLSVYLVALFRANPTPQHWTDTRPAHLQAADLARLTHNKFPIWHDEAALNTPPYLGHRVARPRRNLNTEDYDAITPAAVTIARHFHITAIMGDQLKPRARVSALLEAIGLRFLTPLHPPAHNLLPRNEKRSKRKHANYRPRYELVF